MPRLISDVSGLFEQITTEALKHGTRDFFRGLLGVTASMVFLTYSGKLPISVIQPIQYGLTGFLFLSLGYAAYSMIARKNTAGENKKADIPAITDFREDLNDDYAKRIQDAIKDRLKR